MVSHRLFSILAVMIILLSACGTQPVTAVPVPTGTFTLTPEPTAIPPTPESALPDSVLVKGDYQVVSDTEDSLLKNISGSEVYRSGSEVAVINKATGINLVGQTITGDNGITLTILNSDGIYDRLINGLLSTNIPAGSLGIYSDLVGYKPGGERVSGYLDYTKVPNMNSYIKTMALLSDLNSHTLEPGIDLETTQPLPNQNLIIIFAANDERNPIIASLPNDIQKKLTGSLAYMIANGKKEYSTDMLEIKGGKIMIMTRDAVPSLEPEFHNTVDRDTVADYIPRSFAGLAFYDTLFWLTSYIGDNTDYPPYDAPELKPYSMEFENLFESSGVSVSDFNSLNLHGIQIKEIDVDSF